MGAVVIVAGRRGRSGVAAYDASTVKNVANDAEAAAFAAAGSELEGSGSSVGDIFEGAFDRHRRRRVLALHRRRRHGGWSAGVLALRRTDGTSSPAAMGAATSTTAAPAAAGSRVRRTPGTGLDRGHRSRRRLRSAPPASHPHPRLRRRRRRQCRRPDEHRRADAPGDERARSSPDVRSIEFQVGTSGRTRVLDLTDRVAAFAADAGWRRAACTCSSRTPRRAWR